MPTTDTEATTRMPSLTLMLWKRSRGRTWRGRSMTGPPTFVAPDFTARACWRRERRERPEHPEHPERREHPKQASQYRSSRRLLHRLAGGGLGLGLPRGADAVDGPGP